MHRSLSKGPSSHPTYSISHMRAHMHTCTKGHAHRVVIYNQGQTQIKSVKASKKHPVKHQTKFNGQETTENLKITIKYTWLFKVCGVILDYNTIFYYNILPVIMIIA